MQYRHSALSAAIAASVLAFAAQAQQADSAATDLDAVQVVGIRASLEKSLDTKRNNVTVSEAITAEDIGKFPSTNVAEAFAQIPGVTIDRRFGQGERVSIDGTDPSLNLSFLDGHPVAQAIWLYGEQPNRGFDYTLLSPQILGRAEIVKSTEARLTEGSLGGTVLMHSRRPLDLKANEIAGSVGYSYSQQASEGKPNASLLYSWKNPQETFGIAVSAQHYEERVDRQGLEVFGYAKAGTFANATGVPADADVPNSINAAWFQQDRKRDSAVVNLQLKPSDALEFNLSGLYIKEDFDNYNQSMYSFLTWNPGTIAAVDALGDVRNGVVRSGHSGANANAGGGTVIYDNNVRQSQVTTKGLDLRGAYRGERWTLRGQVGQSKSDNDHLAQYFIEPFYNGGFRWDLDRGIRFDDPTAARNPANWGSAGGWIGNNGVFSTQSKDRYGQLDLDLQFDGVFNQLLAGVRQGKHDEDFALNVYGGVTPGTLADIGTIGLTDIRGFYPDQGQHVQAGRGNVIDWIRNSPVDYANPDPSSYLNNTWALQQTNNAAYVQLNFSNAGLRGNLGLRYVRSKTEGSGFVYSGTPSLQDLDSKWQTRTQTEHFLLPSLNLVYDTDNDWVFRFGAGKVIAWAPTTRWSTTPSSTTPRSPAAAAMPSSRRTNRGTSTSRPSTTSRRRRWWPGRFSTRRSTTTSTLRPPSSASTTRSATPRRRPGRRCSAATAAPPTAIATTASSARAMPATARSRASPWPTSSRSARPASACPPTTPTPAARTTAATRCPTSRATASPSAPTTRRGRGTRGSA